VRLKACVPVPLAGSVKVSIFPGEDGSPQSIVTVNVSVVPRSLSEPVSVVVPFSLIGEA
jgi:hypothetical protein